MLSKCYFYVGIDGIETNLGILTDSKLFVFIIVSIVHYEYLGDLIGSNVIFQNLLLQWDILRPFWIFVLRLQAT